MSEVIVPIARLPHGEGIDLPGYATAGAAGMDVRAAAATVLAPRGRALVTTGFAIALPPGYEAQLRPRSGLALKHGVTVLNAPGTIDSDYRGEVMVLLINHGTEPFAIARGDRIAQMIVAPVATARWSQSASLPDSARGAGGYGSTGRA